MRKLTAFTGVAALALIGSVVWTVSQDGDRNRVNAPAARDIEAGRVLYGEFCAACHGDNLEGQTDWRSPGPDGRLPAPPHDETGHTWHHPDRLLFDYTKLGGKAALANQGVEFDSGMPVFAAELSDEEIWNVLAFIQSTWPERQRRIQAERTSADTETGGN